MPLHFTLGAPEDVGRHPGQMRFLAAQQGRRLRVLVEAGSRGHAENFATVEIDQGRRGEIAWFRAEGFRQGRLIGRRLT